MVGQITIRPNLKARVLALLIRITIRMKMVSQAHQAVVTAGQVDLAVCIIIDCFLVLFILTHSFYDTNQKQSACHSLML